MVGQRRRSADARHAAFLDDADVVIHDTQYDADGYAVEGRLGPQPMEYAVDLAAAVGVRRLVLFHHDPPRRRRRRRLLARARPGGRQRSAIEVDAAAEGAEIVRRAGPASPARPQRGRPPRRPLPLEDLDIGVVVATNDPVLEARAGGRRGRGSRVRAADEALAMTSPTRSWSSMSTTSRWATAAAARA